MFKHIAFACLLGVALAAPSYPLAGYTAVDSYAVPNYSFNYAVNDPHTGDNKAQSEQRSGDYVKGSYSLAEPDGTIRVVDYTAGPHSGFNAVVKRVGAAVHPQIITPVVKTVAPIIAPASLVGVGDWGGHGYTGGWNTGLGAWGVGLGGLGWGQGLGAWAGH
ncbi:hypothetical protein evm_002152 [Chilo suppressalis]|nr:hypothetical protein evm_002152 [Chilo suppressalis]